MSRANRGRRPQPGMKRLTCYYWRTRGNCEHSEETCLYSHRDTGIYAEEPKGKRQGVSSVAGKNARRANPVRTDWREKHGLLPSPRKECWPTSGESSASQEVSSASPFSPGPSSLLAPRPSSTSSVPAQIYAVGAHQRGEPGQRFVLGAIDPAKTPSWRKEPPAAPKASLGKEREELTDNFPTPKAAAPVPRNLTTPVAQAIPPGEPTTAKKAPARPSGGFLLIAQTLRELGAAAAAAARARERTEPSCLQSLHTQSEQYRALRRQVGQVAATGLESRQAMVFTPEQVASFAQRSKYTQSLRKYVDRCWDPEMELPAVFRRLHLTFPADGRLPEEIRRLCEHRDHTERALRFYRGWIRFYTSDILELRRAGNPAAQPYAIWGLDLMDHYLDIACPRLHADLQRAENHLAARAVQYGLGVMLPRQ